VLLLEPWGHNGPAPFSGTCVWQRDTPAVLFVTLTVAHFQLTVPSWYQSDIVEPCYLVRVLPRGPVPAGLPISIFGVQVRKTPDTFPIHSSI
jgi:hypothetical protein